MSNKNNISKAVVKLAEELRVASQKKGVPQLDYFKLLAAHYILLEKFEAAAQCQLQYNILLRNVL